MKRLFLSSLFFIELCDISFSWKIPPKDFLNDFANHEHCYSSILYLPGKHAKGFEWTKSNSNVKIVYHKNVVGKNLSDVVSKSQELHVFIPDVSYISQSINLFKDLYNQRSHSNSERWLLDITLWKSIQDFTNDLKELKLDFGKKTNSSKLSRMNFVYYLIPYQVMISLFINSMVLISRFMKYMLFLKVFHGLSLILELGMKIWDWFLQTIINGLEERIYR